MPNRFQIREFNNLLHDGINYELPMDVVSLLARLDETVEVIDFNSHPSQSVRPPRNNGGGFTQVSSGNNRNQRNKPNTHGDRNRPSGNGGRNSNMKVSPTLEDWGTARQFKTTKFEIKVGVDKLINDIRISLNKITNTTYDKLRDAIIKIIHEIPEEDAISFRCHLILIYM